jgi:2-desacetyl-2-hydroxyethyl bacteriochlorophyllide A dehydrogenase
MNSFDPAVNNKTLITLYSMQALVCLSPGQLGYREMEKPELQKDHAIIRIRRIGICGTDLHAYDGSQPYFSYPRILGHELSGELADADHADGFAQNEAVTIIPYFNCGTCIACRSGKPNCCTSMNVCGVHSDGGMCEYLSVPSYSLLHGNNLSLDELALVEPLAIGAHAVRRAGILAGEHVLVTGAGPIGLGVIEFARLAGANVIVLDVNDMRLAYCRKGLQVKNTINAATENVQAALLDMTNGDMPTVVIDATGNLQAINTAFQYMAHGARYVLVGLQKGEISFSHPEFHKREATLMSSRNATAADFEYVMDCMRKKRIQPLEFITHRVAFENTGNEFAKWLNPAAGVIKAMVELN